MSGGSPDLRFLQKRIRELEQEKLELEAKADASRRAMEAFWARKDGKNIGRIKRLKRTLDATRKKLSAVSAECATLQRQLLAEKDQGSEVKKELASEKRKNTKIEEELARERVKSADLTKELDVSKGREKSRFSWVWKAGTIVAAAAATNDAWWPVLQKLID